jgi:thiamine-monophosphate kinase
VAVTGPLGAPAAALREHRALRPEPLLETGRRLNQHGLCCGDISDGLVRELERFAEMAGIGFRLDATRVPVAPGATLDDALGGGEEVELICVGPDANLRGAGLEPVGSLTDTKDTRAIDGVEDRPRGYDHFA